MRSTSWRVLLSVVLWVSSPSIVHAGNHGGTSLGPAAGFVFAWASDPTPLDAGMGGGRVVAQTTAAPCRGTGPALIRGRLTRAGGLRGVPGIPITLDGPEDCGNLTTTGPRGAFVFSALGPGAYTLTPRQAGCTFTPPSQDLSLAGQNARVHFVMTCP